MNNFRRRIFFNKVFASRFAVAAALWCCAALSTLASGFEMKSRQLTLSINGQFQKEIRWLNPHSQNVVAFDPSAQTGLQVQGLACYSFRLDPGKSSWKELIDPEFGAAQEGIVVGFYVEEEKGIFLEHRLRILLPEKFPDVILFQSSYSNFGKKALHLDRIDSQRLLLDRRLADISVHAWEFATFQGGAYKWGNDYAVIRLQPGFCQSNFQGVEDVKGAEGVGGGMPFIDAWCPSMGVALAHLEKEPRWLSLPVAVRDDQKVELSIVEKPQARLGQQEWLLPGQSYRTVLNAVIFHRLDFHDPLRQYGELLRCRGVAIPEKSPALAYEPYWKSWGFGRDFTLAKMLALLPELKSFGITIANLDDGWYDFMGDWQLNRAPGKFPNGETDMVNFVRRVHQEGFKTSLWWYPLGVDPKSRLAKDHADLLVQDETGEYPLDPSDLYQLCPAYEPSMQHIEQLLKKVLTSWDFDGVYTDFMGLSSIPACFNKSHHHKTPLDSFQSLPRVFELIQRTVHQLKPEGLHEVCICSLPHSPYNMPFYDLANASDPINSFEVRSRIKVEKAIRGPHFAVGDCYQVPLQEWLGSSVAEDFESAMGAGAQLTTFYANLNPQQKQSWNRWFHQYRELDLARAEYVNLYDLAFDRPEGHAIRKANEMFYGFFAEAWPANRPIELRGLDAKKDYQVLDYQNGRSLGTVKGNQPQIKVPFKGNLLLRVSPVSH